MSPLTESRLSSTIHWNFSIIEQGSTARYGFLAGVYYRQVMPGGIEFVARFPPKPVDDRIYAMALTRFKASQLKGS